MNTQPVKVAVAGAAGRMGRALIEACTTAPDLQLVAALEAPDNSLLGSDAGTLTGIGNCAVVLDDDIDSTVSRADVLIDFTQPGASVTHLEACARSGTRAVVGTTGFSSSQWQRIDELAQNMAMVVAPNMSVGVNLTFKLLELAATALGDDVDIEIIEAHHRHKVDAPSGTAVRMGEILATALGRNLSECAIYGREGHTGARDPKTIGFETIRGGDIVGEHTVMFAGLGERLEITHRASSRANFAQGALRATRWILNRENGRFDMRDVLGLQ